MRICVLGAGTMGHGIAHACGLAGNDVTIRDIEASLIERGIDEIESNLQGGIDRGKVTPEEKDATLGRISGTTDLTDAVSDVDLVIEAIPENPDLKKETYNEIEPHLNENTIIGTNTSSLSVTDLASTLERPGRMIGLHFFNPVHIMPLVEIVIAEQTDRETRSFARKFVEEIDKTPAEVTDSPGFASSRLGIALGLEAIRMVESGVASAADIDTTMEQGYNHPMGPIKLTDVVGLDVRLDISEYLHEELGERFRPPQLLKRKVRAGKLGKKTGEGFYVWEDGEPVDVSSEVDK